MKKFEVVKVTFEAYIAVRTDIFDTTHPTLKETIHEKLRDKLEMFCQDNSFGYTEPQTFLEIQE